MKPYLFTPEPSLDIAVKLPYFCNLLRQILTYHLTLLLLLTNVGIPVFTHICHTQLKSWSSVFIPSKSCCQKVKADGCNSSCHATKKSKTAEIGIIPCCEDQSSFVQLDVIYLQQLPDYSIQDIITVPTTGIACTPFPFFSGNDVYKQPHGPPLRDFGRQLLLSYGILRC